MTTKTDAAKTLYPTNHMGPVKRKAKNALITDAVGGGGSKVPQQQKPAVKTTVRPNDAAKKK